MINRVNQFFGYAFYVVGASKVLFVILVLLKLITNLSAAFSGGDVEADYYPTLSLILGFAEIGLMISSIVMLIINRKKQPEVISGYWYGLGAILLEFILPSFIMFFALFAQCSMFMKAGNKITSNALSYDKNIKTTKKMIKETDWFYSGDNNQKDKNEKIEIQIENIKAKLKEELKGWKQLLDSGEIDEETYNQETHKIIEKEKRKIEKIKKQ